MAKATVTIRELKNKDTGIDLTVNNYKETKAMIGSTYEYQVMVVSNLSYFKTAKHKEADNVQFTVLRKFNEFEELYTKMNAKFSGTVFPSFPKKVLMMNEAVAKERRTGLDQILKYISMTPKLCTCSILLEFLGVSAIKAGKFRKMEVSDAVVNKQDDPEANKTETKSEEEKVENAALDDNLFETGEGADGDDDEDDLFSSGNIDPISTEDTKVFEEQDLGGGLADGEGDDLFLPDAVVEKKVTVKVDSTESENDDLFRIEDNLDEIMQLDLNPKKEEDTNDDLKTSLEKGADDNKYIAVEQEVKEETGDVTEPTDEPTEASKPVKPAAKPKPGVKPSTKPKPPISAKPGQKVTNTDRSLATGDLNSNQSENVKQKPVPSQKPKPPLKQKPSLAAKPEIKPKPKLSENSVDETVSQAGLPTENITEDDIMKYIQQNADTEDVDLFT